MSDHDDMPDLIDNPALNKKTADNNDTTSDDVNDTSSSSTFKNNKKSNYYFFKSTPIEEQHKYAPKPIEQHNNDTTPQLLSENKQPGPSTWNAAVCHHIST